MPPHRRWPLRGPAIATSLLIPVLLAGCTVHPPGETEERHAAIEAGKPFVPPVERRQVPELPEHPTPDDLVRRALLSNADLEQKYWAWRAAIEQIPQDGTQATNLALSAGLDITRGFVDRESATLGLGNDPMADIVLPPKLSTAARRALEEARAAGLRFRKAQFELRAKVLNAYAEYAVTAELSRIEESNTGLLQTTVTVVEARNRAGAAGQQDLLRARNELDLSRNELAGLRARLPAQRAALNALLDRPADAPIPLPDQMPASPPLALDDAQVLRLASIGNPELAALAKEIAARHEGVALAKLQYLPDISLGASTDLAGITQSLAGMVTVPLLRHEAIDAAIAQAQANLRAAEAMRRQAGNDLAAQVVLDLAIVRDADRQLALFGQTVLPRARQVVAVSRSAYEAGQSTLLDVLEAQRSLLAIERLVANLRATREKRLAELEAATGASLAVPPIPEHARSQSTTVTTAPVTRPT